MWLGYLLLPVFALGGMDVISLDSKDAWTIRNVTSGRKNHTEKGFPAPVPGTIPGALFAAGAVVVAMYAHSLALHFIFLY